MPAADAAAPWQTHNIEKSNRTPICYNVLGCSPSLTSQDRICSEHQVYSWVFPVQRHTFPGKEWIFGCPGISVSPVSHLDIIPGSPNLPEPVPGMITAIWLAGVTAVPAAEPQRRPRAGAPIRGVRVLMPRNPAFPLILHRGESYSYGCHRSEK